MKTSRKFVNSLDILVAKRKNLVTSATVSVTISSPAFVGDSNPRTTIKTLVINLDNELH